MKLRLDNLRTYTSAKISPVVVTQGQVIQVDDALGAQMLRGTRVDREGEPRPYFSQVPDDTPHQHDCTSRPVVDESALVPPPPQATTKTTASQRVARKTR